MKNKRKTARRIFEMQCDICKAMAHPLRLEVVESLNGKEMAASALLTALGASKASLSKHMTLLVQAGIAEQRKEGRQVYYSLSHPEIQQACAIMRSILYRRLRKDQKLALAMRPPRSR
jgi:ArsR family transcriptional regulator